jgi:phosphoglycerate dehydrogenase-like enzyme
MTDRTSNSTKRDTVAVTSRSFSSNQALRQALLEQYPAAQFNETGKHLQPEETIEFLHGFSKAIVSLEPINKETLDSLPDLKVISKYGVGLDNIDLFELDRRGILLGWQGGTNRRSVSELTLGLMIAALRMIVGSNRALLSGAWRPMPGRQLSGKTVGIVGCGFIGKDLIRLLSPLECRILAHDTKSFPDFYDEHGVEPCGLDNLLREADIVTLHLPLDESTKNVLTAERICQMKPGAILINTARGGLVDESALKAALMQGHLAAAAFDVFSVEPPQDSELLNLPNFLATPHIGGSAQEAILAMGLAAIAGLANARPAFEHLNSAYSKAPPL